MHGLINDYIKLKNIFCFNIL